MITLRRLLMLCAYWCGLNKAPCVLWLLQIWCVGRTGCWVGTRPLALQYTPTIPVQLSSCFRPQCCLFSKRGPKQNLTPASLNFQRPWHTVRVRHFTAGFEVPDCAQGWVHIQTDTPCNQQHKKALCFTGSWGFCTHTVPSSYRSSVYVNVCLLNISPPHVIPVILAIRQ